jgi:hypothetical protein
MARKPEIAELPTRLLMQTLGSERRYKRIIVFGGIAAVLVGGGVFVGARAIDARDTAAREAAWGSLSSCLVGQDALAADETPSARVANIKMGIVGVAPDKRAKAGELSWPASCSKEAYALSEGSAGTPVGVAAEALAKALRADTAATGDLHAEIDKLWAEVATAKIKGAPPADAPQAPKPVVAQFTGAQFKALPKFLGGNFSLANIREEPAPTGGKLYFVIDQKDTAEGPVFCAVSATDTTVKCQKLPEAVATLSPGVRLIGTTEDTARPFFFTGDRGQLGVFPPDGKHAIAQATTYGASAHADGSIAFLNRKETGKELHLTVQPAVGPTNDQIALQPTDFDVPSQTAFFWDWLVWRSPPPKGGASHLNARKLEAGVLKPAVDVGELEEPAPADKAERDKEQIQACKSDDGIALRVRGQKGDTVTFFAGGRWTAPMKSTTRGGAFTCHGLEAVSTTVEHVADRDKDSPIITQSKCNTSGCTSVRVEGRTLLAGLDIGPADAGSSVAADVGGKLLFLWNAGSVGGLRMRLATTEQMKDAPDVVITETREEKAGSLVSSIAGMRVLTTNTYGIVFINTTSGIKLLRVDPATGKLTPLQATL